MTAPAPTHRSTDDLTAAVPALRLAPADRGAIELIVRRPAVNERELLATAAVDPAVGLVGDSWTQRSSTRTADGGPHPDMQLTLMSARFVDLIAGRRDRWPLAGDQVYVDLDLGEANLPVGQRLALGGAVIAITDQPHTGCAKFSERFGADAWRFVNSPVGRELRLRGVNCRVVQAGTFSVGEQVIKLA